MKENTNLLITLIYKKLEIINPNGKNVFTSNQVVFFF